MKIENQRLKKILADFGYIKETEFDSVVSDSQKQNKSVEDFLVEKGLIKDEDLGRMIAEERGFKFIDLKKERIPSDLLSLIPSLVASSNGVVLVGRVDDGFKLGMTDPEDMEARHFVEKRIGGKIFPYYITQQGLESALLQYRAGLQDEFNEIMKRLQDPMISKEEKDMTTVQMVDMLLRYGYDSRASDIHIEPYKEKVNIRFRIDGVMHDVLEVPKSFNDLVVTRVKIMSKMRTDEHRAAQDGGFQFNIDKEEVDIRVSVVPITDGENIVMRILSAKGREFTIADIGMMDKDLEKMQLASKKPHGMILVTGPTGSGKTTTLYALIKVLNKRDVHISTIEDPVEYNIEGISQIQVNAKTDLTFAKGLRAIVRQDPDIIMVGEIRDEETADIAVNSAMTGHLVLSTLHANDSATTLPRLLDMKVEPFLIVSTVNVVVAQRLVRKICDRCRVSYEMTDEEEKIIENDLELKAIFKKIRGRKKKSSITMYKGAGCPVCQDTGYKGRVGIFEVLEMTPGISELIIKKSSSGEIMEKARKEGMTTILEDGVAKIFQGVTTLEEVLRVTKI